MVRDLDMPDRLPKLDGRPAKPEKGAQIEWLERVTVSPEGWISWGGLLTVPPVSDFLPVVVRYRDGTARELAASSAQWRHAGSPTDVVAYRVVKPADA